MDNDTFDLDLDQPYKMSPTRGALTTAAWAQTRAGPRLNSIL